jgi:hypothetical protein
MTNAVRIRVDNVLGPHLEFTARQNHPPASQVIRRDVIALESDTADLKRRREVDFLERLDLWQDIEKTKLTYFVDGAFVFAAQPGSGCGFRRERTRTK